MSYEFLLRIFHFTMLTLFRAEVIRGRQTAAAAAGFSNGPASAAAPAQPAPPPQTTAPAEAPPLPENSSAVPRGADGGGVGSSGPSSKMVDLEKAIDRLGMVSFICGILRIRFSEQNNVDFVQQGSPT